MSDEDQKTETEPKATVVKKTYRPPTLIEYGTVVDLTRGTGAHLISDDLILSVL